LRDSFVEYMIQTKLHPPIVNHVFRKEIILLENKRLKMM
jgi:hypothetical protein